MCGTLSMWVNDYSGRRTSASSPPSWAYAPPRLSARTSSSTRTRSAGSSGPPTSGPTTWSLEVGPGLGSLTLGAAGGRRPGHRRRDRRGARRRAAGTVAARAARTAPTASRSCTPTRCRSPSCPARRRPRWSRTCPTTSPCPCCCTCSTRSRRIERTLVMVQAEVADRLAAGPGNKVYGVPSVKADLVRATSSAPGRSAGPSSGPRRTSTPAWSPSSAATAPIGPPRPGGGLRGGRRRLRPAAQDAARGAGRLGRVRRRRRGGAASPRGRPAAPAARP